LSRSDWYSASPLKQRSKLGDLSVDASLLCLETVDGGSEYFGVELLSWHTKLSMTCEQFHIAVSLKSTGSLVR
jgi:hypothetical protein